VGFVYQDLAVCSCKMLDSLSIDSLDLLPSKGHPVNYGIALKVNQVLTQNQFLDVFLIWRGV